MKFGHSYVTTLQSEGFPDQWVHSAISYRQLKKCIKRVRMELLSLGLGPETLNRLWLPGPPGDITDKQNPSSVGFYYSFESGCKSSSPNNPKLMFIMEPNGDTRLAPAVYEYIDALGSKYPSLLSSPGAPAPAPASKPELNNGSIAVSIEPSDATCGGSVLSLDDSEPYQLVEIPLSADIEFFHILKRGLSRLQTLQEQERKVLDNQVFVLRQNIEKVANSYFGRSHPSVSAWREIFRMYMDFQIFFSTDELNSGERTSAMAHKQFEKFQTALAKSNRSKKLRKDGRVALDSFLRINVSILQNLKFQEINRLALRKILKKFDKKTALHARAAFTQAGPFLAQSVAKAVCRTISKEVLVVIPQITDYQCPICFEIAFKPVRLRCNHVFCIRCLVIMQRAQQNHCAMCRAEVVMEATSENLDKELFAFLIAAFPKETKIKQRENERAASLELYGETYDACSMM